MYLNENNIKNLLNKHTKINNKLYVSYGVKSDNIIWKNINITKKIYVVIMVII